MLAMSVATRLVAFGALLAVLFTAAAAAGGALDPDARGDEAAEPMAGGAHGGDAGAAGRGRRRGPRPRRRRAGLQLDVLTPELRRGREQRLAFRVLDASGARRLRLRPSTRPHAPDRRPARPHRLPAPPPGAGGPTVPGRRRSSCRTPAPTACSPTSRTTMRRRRSPPTSASTVPPTCARCPSRRAAPTRGDGYAVRLGAGAVRAGEEAELRFTVTRDGEPVATEPYLGAGGHLVALREGDLAFLHVHPTDGPSASMADVPEPRPLPPVPPVQARGRRTHGSVHAGGGTMSTVPDHLELPITGMTCASCANRIERKLNKLDGVSASVNYATEKATVDFDAGAVAPEELVAAVEAAGYGADLPVRRRRPAPRTTSPTRRRRCAAGSDRRAALALPVLLLSMIPALQFDNWQWLALQLATPVVLWGGWPFHRAAWANLAPRHRDDGHADLARARSPPGCGRCTRSSSATPACRACGCRFDLLPEGRAATSSTSRSRPSSPIPARRPLLRGARQAPRRGRAHALLELGAKDVALLDDGRRGAPRAGRAARRRRPLRRAPGREGRDRRRRRGGQLGGRPVAADRRVRARREAAGRRGRRRDGQRRRPARRPRDAGRRRHRARPDRPARDGGADRARRPCSGSPTASRACSSRS